MSLRPYQSEAIANVSSALKSHRRVLLQSPTGSGKTVIGGHMIANCTRVGWKIWFLCHRQELIEQTSKTLIGMGIDHGFVAAGYPADYRKQVLVCSVATVGKRLDQLPEPQIIFVDEAHHAVAGTWSKIIEKYPGARVVGLSATPERLDGRGLEDIFSSLVPGKTERWLMDEGWLSDYDLWSHDVPDLSAVKRRGSDFDPEALTDVMTKGKLVGDAVDHYMTLCRGMRAVSFCVSVRHAVIMRDAFREAGVRCEELNGETPLDIRRKAIKAFRAGDLDILTSVDLFGEGFDLPELAVSILQRPTESLALKRQQTGRAFRPVYAGDPSNDALIQMSAAERLRLIANGRKPNAIILDHAGNFLEDRPCTEIQWSLEGRRKGNGKGGGPSAKVCPRCFGASPQGARVCAYCKWEFVLTPREVEEIAGQLKLMEKEGKRQATARQDAHGCKSFAEVIIIYTARGHADPVSSADHFWRGMGHQVTEAEYIAALKELVKVKKYHEGWISYKVRARREALAAKARRKESAA